MCDEDAEFNKALEELFSAWRSNVHKSDAQLVRALIEPMARLGREEAKRRMRHEYRRSS